PGPRDQTIVVAVAAPEAIAQAQQGLLALGPIDLPLGLCYATGIAKAVLVEPDGGLLRLARMLVLALGVGLLVAVDAARAKADMWGQTVIGRWIDGIRGIGFAIDRLRTRYPGHDRPTLARSWLPAR